MWKFQHQIGGVYDRGYSSKKVSPSVIERNNHQQPEMAMWPPKLEMFSLYIWNCNRQDHKTSGNENV